MHAVKNVRLYWHQNPGSLGVSRKCRRPIEWFWNGPRSVNRAKEGKNWIGTNSWKSASLQKVPQTNALAFRDSQEF